MFVNFQVDSRATAGPDGRSPRQNYLALAQDFTGVVSVASSYVKTIDSGSNYKYFTVLSGEIFSVHSKLNLVVR